MNALPPGYFMLSIGVMIVVHLAVPLVRCVPTPWNAIGAVPLLGGIVMAVIADRLFARCETTIYPFAEPSVLVVEGPFRYTRNPMYLGLILALIGLALLLGTLTPWLVIVPFGLILDRTFVRYEQRTMQERFGDDYRAYMQRVRRWL